jgi:hypothetical protein
VEATLRTLIVSPCAPGYSSSLQGSFPGFKPAPFESVALCEKLVCVTIVTLTSHRESGHLLPRCIRVQPGLRWSMWTYQHIRPEAKARHTTPSSGPVLPLKSFLLWYAVALCVKASRQVDSQWLVGSPLSARTQTGWVPTLRQ